VDVIKRSGSKNRETDSEIGDKDIINDNASNTPHEKRSLQNFFLNKKLHGSLRSGSGGSVVTSLSDIERIEKIMN
jgi:hypothetical protein